MTGSASHPRLRLLLLTAGSLAIAALLVSVPAGGGVEPTIAGSKQADVVGTVASISAKKGAEITVDSKGRGGPKRLAEGDKLHLGDVLDPDEGVKAKLQLKVPQGVSADRELIYIKPGGKEEHTVLLDRTGPRMTEVTIGG
jgi:hypothetical protein